MWTDNPTITAAIHAREIAFQEAEKDWDKAMESLLRDFRDANTAALADDGRAARAIIQSGMSAVQAAIRSYKVAYQSFWEANEAARMAYKEAIGT